MLALFLLAACDDSNSLNCDNNTVQSDTNAVQEEATPAPVETDLLSENHPLIGIWLLDGRDDGNPSFDDDFYIYYKFEPGGSGVYKGFVGYMDFSWLVTENEGLIL